MNCAMRKARNKTMYAPRPVTVSPIMRTNRYVVALNSASIAWKSPLIILSTPRSKMRGLIFFASLMHARQQSGKQRNTSRINER